MIARKFLAHGCAVLSLALAAPALADTTVIHAGHIVRDAGGSLGGPATITVTDGRIASIADGIHPAPEGATTIDLGDKTVLPGLIDAHTHLSHDPSGDFWKATVLPDAWYALVGVKNAGATLRAGFTTVRDVGSGMDVGMMLRKGIDEGVILGPRIVESGTALSVIGGHGDELVFRPEVRAALGTDNLCTGAIECAAKVREVAGRGADVIKFHATGGVLSQGDKSLGQAFTDEEMKAIIDTAHGLGLKVAAHAHADAGILAATRAGVDSIEHGTFAGEATLREMKQRGTVLVPTLMAYQGIKEGLAQNRYTPAVAEKVRMTLAFVGKAAKMARAIGVPVIFGTDSGVYEHGRNAEEFALYRDLVGMSNAEALASATTGAAKLLGMENQIGRLAPGYSADMIAVAGNPLVDIRSLEHVDWVMVRGKIAP